MICRDATLSLGVYLLGALEPTDRAEIEAHLAGCELCQAELDELAALPALLDRITLDDIAPEPMLPSDDLFDRVAARARAELDTPDELAQHRRRYHRLVAVAAAAALVVAAAVGSAVGFRHHGSASTGHQPGIHMTVALAAQVSGTGYTVNVSGLPNDEHCKLIAVANDGSRDIAGQWDATYQGTANETGSTEIPRAQLDRFVLLGTHGERLASVTV
jgi:anti-sigma factor RsiW